MTIEVRQACVADRDSIEQFILEAYAEVAPYKGKARWTWQFLENPSRPNSDDRVPVWIAVDGARVVGQFCLQWTTLRVDGAVHPAGWLLDFMVLPSYRGRSLGHRLGAAVVEKAPVLLGLTMAEASRRVLEKQGGITLGPLPQYTKLVRSDADTVRRYVTLRTK